MRGQPALEGLTVTEWQAENAALLAAQMLALSDDALAARLRAYREAQARSIEEDESNAGLRG